MRRVLRRQQQPQTFSCPTRAAAGAPRTSLLLRPTPHIRTKTNTGGAVQRVIPGGGDVVHQTRYMEMDICQMKFVR
jgi:hypothetical protein